MAGLKVAVIMGGTSLERAFSLKSGKKVCKYLKKLGHEILPLDADEHLVNTLRTERPDVCYICLHGKGGEDGSVPALLEFLRIPFVGSRAAVCRAAWNKPDIPFIMRKTYSAEESATIWPPEVVLPVSAFRDLGAACALDLIPDRIGSGFPLAVKPAHGGSALGVSKVERVDQLGEATINALEYDDTVLIEQWVDGCELSCTVIEDNEGIHVLPPVEIHVKDGLYDTDARTDTSRVDYFCPVREESLSSDPEEAARIRESVERSAREVFQAFGLRDLARIDLIWDGAHAMVLDAKTFPGLTETSLVPMAVHAAGIKMSDLLNKLIYQAYERAC